MIGGNHVIGLSYGNFKTVKDSFLFLKSLIDLCFRSRDSNRKPLKRYDCLLESDIVFVSIFDYMLKLLL